MSPRQHDTEETRVTEDIRDIVAAKQAHKLRARRNRSRVFMNIGLFGLVGWSVTIPLLIGIAVGVWLDSRFDNPIPFTLILLLAGLFLGLCNAWYWIQKESREDDEEATTHHD